MFCHFFRRNWFSWTAIKYLQRHIERAISGPKTRQLVPRTRAICTESYVHTQKAYARPAAIKVNGGLRGSKATRWR